jgi:hypothetical protein
VDPATANVTNPTPESNALLDSENDAVSVFSGFSTTDSNTESLPSIGKNDSLFSERVFNVQTILGHLARISTAIRRSGTKYRYRKADATLRKEEFEEFRMELVIAVLLSNMEAGSRTAPTSLIARITDPNQLTPVQERLIQANIVRRNRIKFATRSKTVKGPSVPQHKPNPPRIIEDLIVTAESTASPFQKRGFDTSVMPSQALSIKAPSLTQTATDVGSHLEWQQVIEPKKSTPSVMTRITKTGDDQDYPSCPKPIHGDFLRCPYCADLLPKSYYKNISRWKYGITPTSRGK